MTNTVIELSRFILSLSVLANSSFVITIAFGGINKNNVRLIYLLLALICYPASMYLYITSDHINIFQPLTGIAGVAVAITAVYLLYNFPLIRKNTPLINIFNVIGIPVLISAIKPGYWPNSQLTDSIIRSDISWAAYYLLTPYILTAILLIIYDTYKNQPAQHSRLKKHLFRYFMIFAVIATITDVIVPVIWNNTNVLLTSSASASSIIFSLGLYVVYKKSQDQIISHNNFTQLLTIFLVLLIIFNSITEYETFWLIRAIIIAVALKVGYDTLKQIRSEQTAHEELKKTHLANMEFISDIAHRLKTPLTIIKLKSELALAKNGRRSILTRTLREIDRITTATTNTMHHIVQAGKIDAALIQVNPQHLNLSEMLTGWQSEFTTLTRNHRLKCTIEPNCWAKVDPVLIKEALYNLLDNARKYSPAKSTIGLTVKQVGESIVLTVKDHGQGINQREINHIFDRHWQSQRAEKEIGSSGLGLSLVKWIVQQHQGEITVTSKVTHGTSFTIKLPRIDAYKSRVTKISTFNS